MKISIEMSEIDRPSNNIYHLHFPMVFLMVLTDLTSILLAFGLATLLHKILMNPDSEGFSSISQSSILLILSMVILLAFWWRGLYSLVGLNPVDELRNITSTISIAFLILLAFTFLIQTTMTYSRLILSFAWLFSLILVQGDRWVLRVICRPFWGEPIVVVGNGADTKRIVNFLLNNNHLGMRPVLVLNELPPNPLEQNFLKTNRIKMMLLVTQEISENTKKLMSDIWQFSFQKIMMISELGWVGSLGVVSHDLEGILGMEVQRRLLNFWQRAFKRGMDIILAVFLLVLVSPILLIVSIAIKLEGRGDIFFRHCRIGQNGREFAVLKFRTMVPDADQKLEEILKAFPQFKNEWEATQKLKDDPRLTRIGKFLRKSSIDELPQLINVIRGEMSLVGPRPFFSEQAKFYGDVLNLYYRVRPGMTGMWQVSGRNGKTFAERVRYDEYYIRNWSIWLDIYIMIRTFWVIISRYGAY